MTRPSSIICTIDKWPPIMLSSDRHVPEEQVTPVILDKEEQSDDKQEVAEADENHYNHPGVNWKLEQKDIDN